MPDYIADMTGDDDVAVRWHYNIGGRDLTMAMTAMIDSAGLSQRTIAEVLGVSHQRVNQLLQAS